jgi:hypothetical protein
MRYTIPKMEVDYIKVTNLLGILQNDSKDQSGLVFIVLGLEVDTNLFTLRVLQDKLLKALKAIS